MTTSEVSALNIQRRGDGQYTVTIAIHEVFGEGTTDDEIKKRIGEIMKFHNIDHYKYSQWGW